MKANFRTCPQCATRNRLDKEFCVKCGEPLEGVKAGDPNEAAAGKGKPGFFVTGDEETRSPLVPLILAVVTIGVALAAWQAIREEPVAANTTTAAIPPKVQPSSSPVVAVPMGPGLQDYSNGMAALRGGDFAGAVRFLRLAVAAAGTRADFHLGLAEALEKSGATAESLAEYESAANLDSANVRYTSEWAKALNRAGRNTDAIRAYEVAVQIDNANLSNIKELANLYLKSGDVLKARPHLERIVQLQPDDLVPKQSLAKVLETAKDYEGAAKQYRDILEAMPGADLPRALLSDVLVRQNKSEEALRVLDDGLRLDPDSAGLYREKGRVFDRQQRYAEAIAAYREYIKRAPGAADIRSFTTRITQLEALMQQ